jgi:hypothetical protein
MINFLKKNGFSYCGVVYPLPILKGFAYEKVLVEN